MTGPVDRRRAALYVVLLAMVAFYLAPLEAGLVTAFKTETGFLRTTPFVPPLGAEQFTVDAWRTAFGRLRQGLLNSVLMAVPATVLSALFGSLAAYGLTNLEWRGQVGVLVLFVAGVFLPYQSVLVPLTQFWSAVDLAGRVPLAVVGGNEGLIQLSITHIAYGVPICTVLFRSYYATLDEEMLEAARLDGASALTVYRRIVLPLSVPIFAVTLIYQFTNIWNDLLFALVLVNDPSNQVVTVALNELQGSFVNQYNLQMAGAFIAALPTLVVYVLFGEQFAKGVAGET